MSFKEFDILIVGAGIIGLATARALKIAFPKSEIGVLEKENEIAYHQTGHNSGVIHSGIYYAPGSQKAEFCLTGSKLLKDYCVSKNIEIDACGKLIIATDASEEKSLNNLMERGKSNGIKGLQFLSKNQIQDLEPYATGSKGIYCPTTTIVDYKVVSQYFANDCVDLGVSIIKNSEIHSIVYSDNKTLHLETLKDTFSTKNIVNCAGLNSDRIAKMMGLDYGVKIIPFRGEYFELSENARKFVKGLIYPVPDPRFPFLGVHFTKRIDGSVEAGPNAVLSFSREGYSRFSIDLIDTFETMKFPGFWKMARKNVRTAVSEQMRSLIKPIFLNSLRKLVPEISSKDLINRRAGVRAQAVDGNGKILQDFYLIKTKNSVHVLNAPSPAATSSMAIANHIVKTVKESFVL